MKIRCGCRKEGRKLLNTEGGEKVKQVGIRHSKKN
jgi:hypothetical protein